MLQLATTKLKNQMNVLRFKTYGESVVYYISNFVFISEIRTLKNYKNPVDPRR